MATRKKQQEKVLKTADCPSLSGASTLTYHVGLTTNGELALRIWQNTGGGLFAREWVPLKTLEGVLDTDKPITAGYLKRAKITVSRSANLAGFLLAALKAEGLVEPLESGGHKKTDSSAWLEEMKQLTEGK
ncbi:hypothetical protein [Halochromatium salexigens]|uniref:hypothetical protein n=1 Tax=Halochromatium salexigens TaxID=49447 RepID=UPI001911E33A|nr:hypothetical protein [Halochromatium salexigens]